MEIEYKGANCVVIKAKNGLVVVDPESAVNLRDYGENAVVLYTDPRFETDAKQSGFVVDMPGEFERGEVSISGIAVKRHIDPEADGKQGTMYRIELGSVRLVVLGHIDSPLSEEDLEKIGVVDIAIVPVGGGGYTLDAEDAAAVIKQIEPRAILPVHFEDGTRYEVPQDKLSVFESEFGGLQDDKGASLKLKNIDELPEGPVVIKLKKS
ncbi:MAG: MBL fold metallo-hydrolase [Candidatus Nomurabacteria bacterium]|jgi:hypothetical protein|nr:MBL fold metallo-hydrolase [Candidatus Nomurabacteria bacterium]